MNQPLEGYKNILTVLSLKNYPTVIGFLNYTNRKRISIDIAKNAIENKTVISNAEQVDHLFEFISPLIVDQADAPAVEDLDMEDFEEEQQLVGSLVHLFTNSDLKELSAVRFLDFFNVFDHRLTRKNRCMSPPADTLPALALLYN